MRVKYDSQRALSKVSRAHASKVAFKTGMPLSKVRWLTRKTGTDEQRGQHFPILGSRADLPKLRYRKPTALEKARLTKLELDTAKEERELLDADFKGWLIGVKYKDGSTEEIPIIAKNYTEALRKARPKMNQVASQIDELVLIDPSIGEILHKVGAGARRAAHAIARGVKMAPKKIETFAIKAARKIGRAVALPAEMRESYEAAKKERPWLTPEKFAKENGIPVTEAEWRKEAIPSVYRARVSAPAAVPSAVEEEYTPARRAALAEETRRTIEREARPPERRALDRRALRPFGIPMREYQLQSYHPGAHEEYEEHRISRIQAARVKAAWKERAPVTFEKEV